MPLYYTDFCDGLQFFADEEGSELSDDLEARREALATLAEMARGEFRDGEERQFVVTTRDGAGRSIYRATLILRNERLG